MNSLEKEEEEKINSSEKGEVNQMNSLEKEEEDKMNSFEKGET